MTPCGGRADDRPAAGAQKTGDKALQAGLYALSAFLVAATLAWPPWALRRAEGHARGAAEAALRRVAESERAALAARGRYVPFGPAAAERQAALPGLDLGPAADAFSFDAALDRGGALRLRAVSLADAVRDGRVAPVLVTVDLAGEPGGVPGTGR